MMAENAELKQQSKKLEAELTRAGETIARQEQQIQEMKKKIQELEQQVLYGELYA